MLIKIQFFTGTILLRLAKLLQMCSLEIMIAGSILYIEIMIAVSILYIEIMIAGSIL
jgi:hypothetical protein